MVGTAMPRVERGKHMLYLSNMPYSLGSSSIVDYLQHHGIEHVRRHMPVASPTAPP